MVIKLFLQLRKLNCELNSKNLTQYQARIYIPKNIHDKANPNQTPKKLITKDIFKNNWKLYSTKIKMKQRQISNAIIK